MPQSVRFVTEIQNWSPERICLKFTLLFLLVLVWVEAEKCVQLSKTGRFEMNWYMLLIANWVFRLHFYAYLSHLWSPLDAKYMHAYTTQTIREIRPAVLAVEKTSTYCNPTNPRCFSEENNSDPLSADGGRSTGWVGRGPRWFCMAKGHIWHDIDIFEICAWSFSWGPVTRAALSNKCWFIAYGLIILHSLFCFIFF